MALVSINYDLRLSRESWIKKNARDLIKKKKKNHE